MDGTQSQGFAPVSQEVSQLDASSFGDFVDRIERKPDRVIQAIKQSVEEGELSPYEGAKMVSAAWGIATGYEEFHGQVRPVDLIAQLAPKLGQRQPA